MKNNTGRPQRQYSGNYEPFSNDSSFRLQGASGSIGFCNPTSAQYELTAANTPYIPSSAVQNTFGDSSSPTQRQQSTQDNESSSLLPSQASDASFLWRSRDNRKGRHALLIRSGRGKATDDDCDIERTNTPAAIVRGLRSMATLFPYWDISWVSAVLFTLGSMVWIANGFIVVLPLVDSRLPQEMEYASAWSAVAGASIILTGSILGMLEATNAYKSGCFGWVIERTVGVGLPRLKARPGPCHHSHHRQGYHGQAAKGESGNDTEGSLGKGSNDDDHQLWEWLPSWRDLREHYLRDLGFVACGVQLCSAIVFWSTKFIALPDVSKHLSPAAMNGVYWAPNTVACLGFILASTLIMVETQSRWYMPAITVLGWHVGFWKFIGSIGFTTSAVLGPFNQQAYPSAHFHSNFGILWGSSGLLIGSLIEWYESLSKNPVVREGTHSYSEYNTRWAKDSAEEQSTMD